MKDSRYADAEMMLGGGVLTKSLVEAGAIASDGVITGMLSQVGTNTGLSVIADLGAGGTVILGGLGPLGLLVAGGVGLGLILHGLYRGS